MTNIAAAGGGPSAVTRLFIDPKTGFTLAKSGMPVPHKTLAFLLTPDATAGVSPPQLAHREMTRLEAGAIKSRTRTNNDR